MWYLGIASDHFPRPSYEENKVTYHCRPGLDLTAKMLAMPLDKIQIKEYGLLKPLSQFNL